MTEPGRFYDLDQGEPIKEFVVRDSGNELVFDIPHSDKYHYTVNIKRQEGTLFKGTAISQPGGDIAAVTCRVFEDVEEDLLVISGSGWKYPHKADNYRWFVHLQK